MSNLRENTRATHKKATILITSGCAFRAMQYDVDIAWSQSGIKFILTYNRQSYSRLEMGSSFMGLTTHPGVPSYTDPLSGAKSD